MLRLRHRMIFSALATIATIAAITTSSLASDLRHVVSLDGTWQIAEGSMNQIPTQFNRTVPVPGLVDMATPPFEGVGANEKDRRREAFWYQRTFRLDGPVPAVARLKIHKAKFGSKVFLNGKLVGEHLPSFTPALLDVQKYLKGNGQKNILTIRIGSCRASLPKSIPNGFDKEKIRYLPGIYDSVELILTGNPYILRVQAVPSIDNQTLRVVATLKNIGTKVQTRVCFRVCETDKGAKGKEVASVQSEPVTLAAGEARKIEVTLPIKECRLWSPEDPFLYGLDVTTDADSLYTRFGMRSFHFDPETKMAILNGRPYPLRGTNTCLFRFFEDPDRDDLPWREDWVRRLHQLFKGMHWNSIRYCIGFPPELWYDIADEEGLLIQDEFPIWNGLNDWPEELKSEELIKEYTEWMQERWNHPSVVIWDANNETRSLEPGKAIKVVRKLDLSNRPWDNGYNVPDDPNDTFEAHPYFYFNPRFRMDKFETLKRVPGVPGGKQGSIRMNTTNNPVIINEYGWL